MVSCLSQRTCITNAPARSAPLNVRSDAPSLRLRLVSEAFALQRGMSDDPILLGPVDPLDRAAGRLVADVLTRIAGLHGLQTALATGEQRLDTRESKVSCLRSAAGSAHPRSARSSKR